ncbi:MAG: vanadium-dependent haloperoxidase [Acidobacteriota bacterium]
MSKSTESPLKKSDEAPKPAATDVSRRGFLRGVGGAGLMAAGGLTGAGALVAPTAAEAEVIGPLDKRPRQISAFQVRNRAARNLFDTDLPDQECNGDDSAYADRRASFFKTFPQNNLGEVDTGAYSQYLDALANADQAAMEAVPASPQTDRKLANPLGAFAYEITGGDGHSSRLPPAPSFAGPVTAAEMGEVYWQALTRDVPFNEYESDPLVGAAVADLNSFSQTVGPTAGGAVTAGTIFRGETAGDLVGPYVSQFLWLDIPFGQKAVDQRYNEPVAGDDFMVDYNEWLAVQRGAAPTTGITFDPTPRYISSNRGLGEWVHADFTYQGYLNAALIMLGFGADALSARNPYLNLNRQGAFVTFGGPQVLDLVTKAAVVSLKAAWYQKWLVHRRLRPEVYAGRVENQQNGAKDYGLHPDILGSDAVSRLLTANGNALMPSAFPEGSPTHPSYPAGHATIAGACCTVLKAFFNESYAIQSPVVSSSDGLALDAWTGDDLTLGNEINKLANNISIGRDAAGVHYRSDGVDGLTGGEQVAIGMLQDYSIAFAEMADGFELTRFDGQKILIQDGSVSEI